MTKEEQEAKDRHDAANKEQERIAREWLDKNAKEEEKKKKK